MSEETTLSPEELGAILGDDTLVSDAGGGASGNNASDFNNILQEAKSSVKQVLSQSLGEEVELDLSSVEDVSQILVEGVGPWFVARGSFSNGGEKMHLFVFSSEMAKQIVIQYSGVEDVAEEIEQISGPLTEFSQSLIDEIAKSFGNDYNGNVGDFQKVDDMSQFSDIGSLIKAEWKIGASSFFQFFDSGVLSDNYDKSADSKTDEMNNTNNTNSATAGGILDVLGSDGVDDSLSLSDALLDGNAVSDVKMPSFDEEYKAEEISNEMKLLMDVSMDVSVELGSTKKMIRDILELNRGSIIELKKLAGEPLDIKVNDKLIARGEVVVIDEYFGVRIIEIVSPYEKKRDEKR